MNGLFTINGRNKVAFWDKGANVNLPSGNDYRYFSHVIDGRLPLVNNRIITGNANERSSDLFPTILGKMAEHLRKHLRIEIRMI